ncbi:MAG: thiamine phosphate synthase, partial [Paludibacteraceae bacterium]|nr:thiamine phosphate synthase [Paludibacteraceae bacterium]
MIIVITKPEFFPSEAEQIESLLRSGRADVIHIRKPGAAESEVERLICSLPKEFYSRLVLHDHHHLALKY